MERQCFRDFPLRAEIMKGIEELGFSDLFPIQAQAINPLLERKDVIGQAQTGTGKTAAFGIPMIERLATGTNSVQGLFLVPTRELAQQVAEQLCLFGKYARIGALPVYGGAPLGRQIRELERGVQIVVGTPGRTIDLLERRILNLKSVKTVVLDEADRMLDMGFVDDIDYILSVVPSNRQTCLFSATIDQSVMQICRKYMKNPEKILVSKDEIANTQMDQFFMVVNPYEKFEALCGVLGENHIGQAIVFCRRRIDTNILSGKLRNRGYDAKPLHAGLTQPQRDFLIDLFRRGKTKF